MKIILHIFVLFALTSIAKGQLAAAARGLYQPIILSVGAAIAYINDKVETDGHRWNQWTVSKFTKKETIAKENNELPENPEYDKALEGKETIDPTKKKFEHKNQ